MNEELLEKLKIFGAEAFNHRRAIAICYVLISLAVFIVGLQWPQIYKSSATIIVDNNNVIKPLTEGTAVPTDISEHARLAKELIYSRNVLDKVLNGSRPDSAQLSPAERESLINRIKGRTKVLTVRDNLIDIEYTDSHPEKAKQITQLLADSLIAESVQLKINQGNSAYEFIDNQAQQYRKKLIQAEERLQNWRNSNIDILGGLDRGADSVSRITAQIEEAEKELTEKRMTKAAIERQLAGESKIIEYVAVEDPDIRRLADLEAELRTLRLRYLDTFPDVIAKKQQIEDLKQFIERNKTLKSRPDSESGQPRSTGLFNPLVRDLRLELYRTDSRIAILNNIIAELRRKKAEEGTMTRKINDAQTVQAELKRDYDVNFGIYQDLLKRREQARISMNLDIEGQGKALRVFEPAYLPSQPSGLRFLYFIVGGQLLGFGVPLGILFAWLMFDSRIRSETVFSQQLDLPVFGIVPHIETPREAVLGKLNSSFTVTLITVNVGLLLILMVLNHVKL